MRSNSIGEGDEGIKTPCRAGNPFFFSWPKEGGELVPQPRPCGDGQPACLGEGRGKMRGNTFGGLLLYHRMLKISPYVIRN